MVLSDRTIQEEIAKGRIVMEPFDFTCIERARGDVYLNNQLPVFKTKRYPSYIDVRQDKVVTLSPPSITGILPRSAK